MLELITLEEALRVRAEAEARMARSRAAAERAIGIVPAPKRNTEPGGIRLLALRAAR
jgi:hypothetical protein